MNVIELEFKDEKSNKFWRIQWTNDSYTVTYGRIGSNGTTKTTNCADAEVEAIKQAKAKMKKGYVEVSPSVTTPTNSTKKIFEDKKGYVSIFFTDFHNANYGYYYDFVSYFDAADDEEMFRSEFTEDFDLSYYSEDNVAHGKVNESTNDYAKLFAGVRDEDLILPHLDKLTGHLKGKKFNGVYIIYDVHSENLYKKNYNGSCYYVGSFKLERTTSEVDNILNTCTDGKQLYEHAKKCIQGQGCTDKEEDIVKLLVKAKECGFQYALVYGANIQRDLYLKKDFNKAIKYYFIGIEHGDGPCAGNLSTIYGNINDLENSFKYKKISLELGYFAIAPNLGYCYQYGVGTEVDFDKAFETYQIGAKHNDSTSIHNLGVCYREGEGAEKNLEMAFKYFKMAADLGNVFGHNNLGVCYSDGKGCPEDKEKALYHYKQAFDKGSPQAATNLGEFYEEGIVVKQDFDTALSYYNIAKSRGCETGAKKLEELTEKIKSMPKPSSKSNDNSIYLEFKDDKSNKFYKVEWDENSYTVTYGRIGADGTTKTTDSDNPEVDARKQADSKIKKGYVEVENNSGNDMAKKASNVFAKLVEKGGAYIEIKPYDKENIKLKDSKFGGTPFLPKNLELPESEYNGTLMLIAQINLSQVPKGVFPIESGFLQFYVDGACDVLGLDFDDQYNTEGFRVLYFEDTKDGYTEDEMEELYNPETDESPIEGQAALKFKVKSMGVTPQDDKYEKLFVETWNELYPNDTIDEMDDIDDEIIDDLHDSAPSTGHRLLGFPFFTQSDPRYGDDEDLILLFQIDTDSTSEFDICIGDSGVMNFFIKKEDLDNKDFSKVFYNWDCF